VPIRVPEPDEIQDARIIESIGRVDPRIGRDRAVASPVTAVKQRLGESP
jgi:hypothetical protein